MYTPDNLDTICAISTPPGTGGIAVVRISGKEAIETASGIWHGKSLSQVASHTAHLGDIIDPDDPAHPLDTAVATIFRSPRSFTGEDVVELSIHGSKWIQRELINLLIRRGCRVARPGEFTRRAFINGRLDLAQAEAVADIIASSSRSAHRLAIRQIRGDFSHQISTLRDQLIEIASLLELELDFSEEEVEFASRTHLLQLARDLHDRISRLASSFSTGAVLKDGVPVAIVGEPNAGKSTLLNLLLGDNRAIVSNIPGTTRDTIEDTVEIQGTLFRFIDTAGLRDTTDQIESLGIQRSLQAISKARIILWVTTPDVPSTQNQKLYDQISQHLPEGSTIITVINKIDLHPTPLSHVETTIPQSSSHPLPTSADPAIHPCGDTLIPISATNRTNLPALLTALVTHSGAEAADSADIIVTNARHYQALTDALQSTGRVIQGLTDDLSGDLIAQDLRETIHHLSLITGDITTTDLLTTIFQKFCIGK